MPPVQMEAELVGLFSILPRLHRAG